MHRVELDGVIVRYEEDAFYVTSTVEGVLPDDTTARVVEDARRKLSELERTEYVARRIVL